jgi:hypothetical protein
VGEQKRQLVRDITEQTWNLRRPGLVRKFYAEITSLTANPPELVVAAAGPLVPVGDVAGLSGPSRREPASSQPDRSARSAVRVLARTTVQDECFPAQRPSCEIRAKEGLLLQQLDNLSDPEPQIDKADELRRKYGTANGQLWQVGPHRIVCGDSREPQTVGRLWDIA